ncbi:MAG: bifunctional 3-hydroxydecanoyl-ACP dehydratase/trans-2-decenoyl-ACP isomerase [Spirochaetes bacterium]|nr:bifunctional 3-hydroxydecanoyl-ACP dehydratase/trans-2-decenoyl-ACP isomerase [Spirochaetota bacterium]
MKYNDFLKAEQLDKYQLMALAHQQLIDDPPGLLPSLPAPPMLMLDRVVRIIHDGKKGQIVGEQDIHLDSWFFGCHFRNDPVQPGCLGVDAVWQLLGLYCTLRGAVGTGRALGCQEVEFFGQIRPHNKTVTYNLEIRRYTAIQGNAMVVASAKVLVDNQHIYNIKDAKVGIFPNIQYPDFPKKSANAMGGILS